MLTTHPALVLSTSGQIRLESVPTKHPRTGEILVAPLRASICGDLTTEDQVIEAFDLHLL